MRIPVLCLAALLLVGLLPAPAHADEGTRRGRGKQKLNRLAGERSPYLRQHATNPVDWYPWGPEAFDRARAENKPVFLSIGYAACHWCHVMERQSFEDPVTARLLNSTFICVKVDREERPDLDRVYMNALYALGKRGGWPMTVILTPDAKPFWGGTYLSAPNVRKVAEKVKGDWAVDRGNIETKAEWTVQEIRKMSRAPRVKETRLSDRDLVNVVRLKLQSTFDLRNGGIRAAKKFPPHGQLDFYLDGDASGLSKEELKYIAFTLAKMEEGGIQDHVGGGFHRYTVDERWFLPHFEKMLYDNALLIRAYARMYGRTAAERYRRVARRALTFVVRDLGRPGGGFASGLDADTKDVEGLTYTWSADEVKAAMPPGDAGFISNLMGIRTTGNYNATDFGARNGRNVVYLPAPVSQFAKLNGTNSQLIWMRMDAVLGKMLTARRARAQPALDDKVITAWNGLLLGAMADAGAAMEDRSILVQAEKLAEFLLTRSRRDNGTLLRFPQGSGKEIMGFCEDYVHLIDGLLTLSEATGKERYVDAAADLGRRLIRGFEDPELGGFWATSHRGHEVLIARHKSFRDNPIPSDNGTAARVLLELAVKTGDPTFRQAADRTLAMFRPLLAVGDPTQMTAILSALRLRDQMDRSGVGPAPPTDAGTPKLRVRQDVALVELYVDGSLAKPGDEARVRIRVALDEGWHVNAHEPSREEFIGVTLRASNTTSLRIESARYPDAKMMTLALGDDPCALYDGTFEIEADVVRLSAGDGLPELVLTLQACSRKTCKEAATVFLPIR